MSSSPAAPKIMYLGLDVHKDSVTIAALPADASAPTRSDKYPNDCAKLRRVVERCAKDGAFRACYEASGAGYMLQRAMQDWGYHCDVIAPSLIPITPGVQRKRDTYDAGQLARLYRAGALTVIRIPSEAEERVRPVVRCRETLQREVVKSRHYTLKFRARRGFIYRGGVHWRPAHYTWRVFGFLAVVLDVFSRKVIGYAIGPHARCATPAGRLGRRCRLAAPITGLQPPLGQRIASCTMPTASPSPAAHCAAFRGPTPPPRGTTSPIPCTPLTP